MAINVFNRVANKHMYTFKRKLRMPLYFDMHFNRYSMQLIWSQIVTSIFLNIIIYGIIFQVAIQWQLHLFDREPDTYFIFE